MLTVGTPAWIDLTTHDKEGAKEFYRQLFGWTFEDFGPEFGNYTIIHGGGGSVGGLMGYTDFPEGAVPTDADSKWSVYLAVDDADQRVQRALDNGASVVMPPMPVEGTGTFAEIADPFGAHVGMWQSDTVNGVFATTRERVTGVPSWFELLTTDVDGAAAFYTKVFDFNITDGVMPMENGELRWATNGDPNEARAGILDVATMAPGATGSWWQMHFAVDDYDSATEKAKQLGADVKFAPYDAPCGRTAGLVDPTGATFFVTKFSRGTGESK